MTSETVVQELARQKWVQPVEDTLQKSVLRAYKAYGDRGMAVKDFLHGVWLGHPLHPAITDVPIGAWFTAAVFDFVDAVRRRDKLAGAAQSSVLVGMVGAVGAAVTGITDWSETDGRQRRLGVFHAASNSLALGLYTTSYIYRRRGNHPRGRMYGFLGLAAAAAGAFLGGKLVYSEKVGVDHAPQALPRDFVRVMAESDLPEGQLTRVEAEGTPVVLLRRGTRIDALAETCSHLGGPLSEGTVEDDCVTCPWHGSTFAMEDGRVVHGPATHRQPAFETRIRGGQIEVRAVSE